MAVFNLFNRGETRSVVREGTQNYSLSDAGLAELIGGTRTFTGETVNRQTALGVPAVARAVGSMADSIASLPLQLFKKGPEGRQTADRDPLYRIVHDVVNADLLTSFQWRKWLIQELMLEGRALTFIERNKAGRVMGLWPMAISTVVIDVKDGRRRYTRNRVGGGVDVYYAAEVLDFVLMPAADGISHINPVHNSRNAIGLAIAAERYASTMFENGGVPPFAVTGPLTSPASATRASLDVTEAIKLARKSKKPAFALPTGFDLKEIGFDPQKQQMVDLRKFQITEVARIWNVPPVLLHDLTGGTFNNAAQQASAFVKFCLTPILALLEAEMNTKLFSAGNTNFIEFNVDGLLRGDDAARSKTYGDGFKNAWLTPNEIREMENRPRSTQPEADLLHVQGATVPLGMQSTAQPVPSDTQSQTEDPADPGATDQ